MSETRQARKNIVANYFAAGTMVIAPVLAMPWYLKLLGPEQFGLLVFLTTLQVFLALLDSGISQISMREFSVRMSGGAADRLSAAALLLGFERVYVSIAIAASGVTLLAAPFVASHWLVLDSASTGLGTMAVCGGAVIFLFQFPGTLYRSFLNGAQAQVGLNVIAIFSLILRHGGSVLLLMWRTELSTYLCWQILMVFVETLLRIGFSWHVLRLKRSSVEWNMSILRPILPTVAKMSGAVIIGSLAAQSDKIILSKLLPIEDFGYYAIATTVSQGVLQLIYPLMQAMSPKMMQLHNDPKGLRALNVRLSLTIGGIILISGIGFAIAGRWFLDVWLGDPHVTSIVHPVVCILLVGSALNALYHVGYYNWLALGSVRRILGINLVSLLISVVMTPLMVIWQGMIGATFGFAAINLIGFLISLEWAFPFGKKAANGRADSSKPDHLSDDRKP